VTIDGAPGSPSVQVAHAPAATGGDRRAIDLSLARLHLRIGSLASARTELETLAGRGPLDDQALIDLAEARWRTGDTIRAGEAATTVLDHGSDAPLALLIAAEAAVAGGRPGEARRLATRAMSAAGGTLDALFAGMPRSAVWPPDPADPAPSATTLFGDDNDAGVDDRTPHRRATDPPLAAHVAATAVVTADAEDANVPGLWDADADASNTAGPMAIDPAGLMDAGLAALSSGDADRAAGLLGLAIRTGPHLAPAILDGTIDVTQPALLLVRGDAFRATGSEAEAAVAYAAAARALGEDGPVVDAALQSGPTTSPSQ
jgi:hypothetical protein